jgi:hypothetical protein
MIWKVYAPSFHHSFNLVHEYTFKNNSHKYVVYLRARKDQPHTLAAPIKTTHDNNNGLSSQQ